MITTKVVPFIKNEVQKVSNRSCFEIIDIELNKPDFGEATIYINCPADFDGYSEGLFHRNYILCYANEELDSIFERSLWNLVKTVYDSKNKPVFFMVPKNG